MAVHRSASKAAKPARRGGYGTDWGRLFKRLQDVYKATGQDRQKAVLDNHSEKKESICRKLGVVCDADVDRIAEQLGLGRKA